MAQSNFTTLNDLVFPFNNYVLALPGWYPTWLDPLPGDFNQRHIMAASIAVPQLVLYIGKDPSGTLKKREVRFNQLSERIIEIIVIYPAGSFGALKPMRSNFNFLQIFLKWSRFIKNRWGAPKLVHSYIVIRGGLAGWWLSRKWKLPFVLTENWTIYYETDPGYLPGRPRSFRWAVRRVFNSVSHFLPVTLHLYQRVERLIKPVPFSVVPNVVDTGLFFPVKKVESTGYRFVHVSTMIYQKNPEGLLRSFKIVQQQNPQATLLMVGPYDAAVKEYATALGFSEKTVRFAGAVSYKKVAEMIQSADALVLFSRYENLACVILEALCCGVPVVSTNVGGIAEVINESNGLLVENGNEAQLIGALQKMIDSNEKYNASQIAANAKANYSMEAVGERIGNVYKKFISI